MKTSYNIILALLLVFCVQCFKINAQQTDENTVAINRYFQGVNSEISILNNTSFSNQFQTNFLNVNNADLKINQIGDYNYINVKAKSNYQEVNQLGNNNSYEFISFYGRNDLNFEIQQNGSNNFIQVLGENSLIDNMKIIQNSDFKTITITNY